MIKTFLFDLDGTMLPMQTSKFVKAYFSSISKKFAPILGVTEEKIVTGIISGIDQMVKHGEFESTNKERFWKAFSAVLGSDVLKYEKEFDEYYNNEFIAAKEYTKQEPLILESLNILKDKGYKIIAATNPVFPYAATSNRIKWAGLKTEMFSDITTYENSHFCKPDPRYFNEILKNNNLIAQQCILVGNDVKEDMCAEKVNIETFLVTDCIETHGLDYSKYRQGTYIDLKQFIDTLPSVQTNMPHINEKV